jgi:NADH-quinone oxidoreductase subunit A
LEGGSNAMNPYVAFLLYLMAILGFVGLTLLLNRMLGPKPMASAIKLEPFECGATPVGTINVKAVPIKYYAIAIVFILFDLETVFLFIWALGAQPLTGFMLFTFFIFMALLVLILLYVYKARLIEAVTQ